MGRSRSESREGRKLKKEKKSKKDKKREESEESEERVKKSKKEKRKRSEDSSASPERKKTKKTKKEKKQKKSKKSKKAKKKKKESSSEEESSEEESSEEETSEEEESSEEEEVSSSSEEEEIKSKKSKKSKKSSKDKKKSKSKEKSKLKVKMAREYSPEEKSIKVKSSNREKTSFERELEQFSRDRNLDKVSPNEREKEKKIKSEGGREEKSKSKKRSRSRSREKPKKDSRSDSRSRKSVEKKDDRVKDDSRSRSDRDRDRGDRKDDRKVDDRKSDRRTDDRKESGRTESDRKRNGSETKRSDSRRDDRTDRKRSRERHDSRKSGDKDRSRDKSRDSKRPRDDKGSERRDDRTKSKDNGVIRVDERENRNGDDKDPNEITPYENNQGDIDQTEIERLPEDFADPDREPLETAYGMPFPLDFFRMYECMARLSPNDPLTAFSVVGLLAVGPFEELHKMKRFDGYLPDPECQMKLHMQHRFYFDPPEFQTLFISNKDTFHLGYYRVAPDQMPAFLVGNEGTNKIVTSEGSNLLAGFKNYIWMKQRESSRTGASNLKKVYDEIAKFTEERPDVNSSRVNDELIKKSFQAESKSAHAMGVIVPWDYHSGKILQQRVKRKAGYGHIGYSLDEIELMFSNVVNCIDDFSRAKALKPFETLAARITDQDDGRVDAAILGLELGMDLFSYGAEPLHDLCQRVLCFAYRLLSRNMWADILERHLNDRRRNDYHRSDIGRDGRVVKVVKVPPRSLIEQLGGRKGPRKFLGGASDWM